MAKSQFEKTVDTFEVFTKKIITDLQDNLDKRNVNASGNLRASIQFPVKFVGQDFIASLILPDYYKFVDKGVKGSKSSALAPQSPFNFKNKSLPYDKNKRTFPALNNFGTPFGWIQTRGIQPRNMKGPIERQVRSLAFLIARKIKERGISPTNFYSDIININKVKELNEKLTKALGEDVKIFLKKL